MTRQGHVVFDSPRRHWVISSASCTHQLCGTRSYLWNKFWITADGWSNMSLVSRYFGNFKCSEHSLQSVI